MVSYIESFMVRTAKQGIHVAYLMVRIILPAVVNIPEPWFIPET